MASRFHVQRRAAAPAVSLFLVLASLCRPGEAQAGGPDGAWIEVQFEPLKGSPGDPSVPDLLSLLGGGGSSPATPSSHGKEDELDRSIEAMVASMLSNVGGPPAQALRDGRPIATAGGRRPQDGKSTLPLEAFKAAFPGPLISEEDGASSLRNFPFQGSPDPLVLNMLDDLNSAFQGDVLPIMHSAAASAALAPGTCHDDLKAHCSSAPSKLHCLGQHMEDISDACRKLVGQSVPFVCSSAIDKWCDVLHAGVLSCLEQHTESLEVDCKDAVAMTRTVIHKANTQKVSVVNKADGKKKVVMPFSLPPRSSFPSHEEWLEQLWARKMSEVWYFLYGAAVCVIAAVLISHYLSSPLGSRWWRLVQARGPWMRKLGFHGKDDDGSSVPLVRIELPRAMP